MLFHEKNKDKVLVYDFSPKKEEILNYKKGILSKSNENCFYKLDTNVEHINMQNITWIKDQLKFSAYDFDNSLYKSVASLWPFPNVAKDLSKQIKNDYLVNNGCISTDIDGYTFFFPNHRKEALKLSDTLSSLYLFENGNFNCVRYDEIVNLFSFAQIKEYNFNDIEELIQYGLIDENLFSKDAAKVRTLKNLY